MIVGASHAGTAAAQGLRRAGYAGRIALIGGDPGDHRDTTQRHGWSLHVSPAHPVAHGRHGKEAFPLNGLCEALHIIVAIMFSIGDSRTSAIGTERH